MSTVGKQVNGQDAMCALVDAQLFRPTQTEPQARSHAELLYDLEVHQIELEMQNDELRRTLLSLEESRNRYVDFYDFAPVGYLTLSGNGLITEINLTGATLIGVERRKLLRHRFASFVVPEDSDHWHRYIMDALLHDSKLTCELRIRRSDGVYLDIQLDSMRRVRKNHAPDIRIVMTDISERKLVEASLQKTEAHLRFLEQREIVQTSLDGFWVVDAKNARIIEVNDAFCGMLGYARDELLSMHVGDLEVDASTEKIKSYIKKIMKVGHDLFETRYRHKQGHIVSLEISASLSEIDGGKLFVFARDITKRKRAEELLRKSYEEIRDLYNNAACGYHSLDKDGIFCRINNTELAWIGYTRDEVIGKMKWTDLLTLNSIKTYQETFPRLMKQGFIHDIESEIICKDGTVLIGLISATSLYDQNGNFLMTRSTMADITERKRSEKLLRELSAHAQTVREDEKARIAREIHDELGSTLAAIKIDAKLLADRLFKEVKILPLQKCVESIYELIDSAIKSTRRIITDLRPPLLDDLGLFAALEWQCAEFEKRQGIECRIVCGRRKDKGCEECIKCEYKLDETLSITLFRISQEALTNVARHSGASKVKVVFQPGNNDVVLSISDNGCGLPEGHVIASTSYGMRGMRERVEHLGGEIKFYSLPDHGLSVTIKLPLHGLPE